MPSDDPFGPSQRTSASQAGTGQSSFAVPPNLTLQTTDVRPFARLLRGIGFRHQAIMTISEAGLEVAVEDVKTLCATAFIPASLFSTFEYHPPPSSQPPVFEINLDALLQCLNIFGNAGAGAGASASASVGAARGKGKGRWAGEGEGGNDDADDDRGGGGGRRARGDRRTALRMVWMGEGEPLSMFLREDGDKKGPVTTCELKTLFPEDLMDQNFEHESRVIYIIMKSEWLRDALLDIPPSSTKIKLTATPPGTARPPGVPHATSSSDGRRVHKADAGSFSISAEGDFGSTQLDYPNDREVMDRFECNGPIAFTYHTHHFTYLARALQHSLKIALMIEDSGFLCIQIMMPVGRHLAVGDHQGIIEFKMHALSDND